MPAQPRDRAPPWSARGPATRRAARRASRQDRRPPVSLTATAPREPAVAMSAASSIQPHRAQQRAGDGRAPPPDRRAIRGAAPRARACTAEARRIAASADRTADRAAARLPLRPAAARPAPPRRSAAKTRTRIAVLRSESSGRRAGSAARPRSATAASDSRRQPSCGDQRERRVDDAVGIAGGSAPPLRLRRAPPRRRRPWPCPLRASAQLASSRERARRGGDGAVDQRREPVLGHQHVERGAGRAAGARHVLAQLRRRLGREPRQLARAGDGRARQAQREIGRQPRRLAGLRPAPRSAGRHRPDRCPRPRSPRRAAPRPRPRRFRRSRRASASQSCALRRAHPRVGAGDA